MKKVYTFAIAVLASASLLASAQSLDETQTLWAKTFANASISGANPTSAGYGMTHAADGSILTLGNIGSTNTEQDLQFGGETLGKGTAYAGNSANLTLCITKIATDGTLQWSVLSKQGEADNTQGACIVGTPDGGAVAYVNMRASEGHYDLGVTIVDAKGVEFEMPMTLNNGRHYEPAVFKIDADGGIEWFKQLTVNAVADPAVYTSWTQSSNNIGQGIYTYGLEVDNAGNIYLAGRMTATVTIDGITIEPHNVADWTGDSQKNSGNLYIIKLDENGNYVKHLVTGGEAAAENARALKIVGNKLYLFAMIEGKPNTEISLGEQSVTPTNAYNSLCAAQLDTDLNVEWFKYYQSTISGSTLQMPTMSVINDNIYLMGTAKMAMTIGNQSYSTINARDPWMLQIDGATGEALNCLTYKDGQHGFFGVYEGVDGYLYAIERGLGSMNPNAGMGNVHMGTAIHKIDPVTFTTSPSNAVVLISKTTDGYGALPIGDKLFVYDRQPNGNKEATYINSNITFMSSAFIARVSAFELPATAGAVLRLTIDADDVIDMAKGDTRDLVATLTPDNVANDRIIWSSSNEGVVTVDENGTVTAMNAQSAPAHMRKAGTQDATSAIITATSASNPNVKASVKVNVSNLTAITDIKGDSQLHNNIYTIDGRLVKKDASSIDRLPAGIYIVGNKKVVIR